MSYDERSDQDSEPTEDQLRELLGSKAPLWASLRQYLGNYYPQCVPVSTIEGQNASYTIRYRQSGKTLVTLHPAKNDLTVLVVLGKKEVAKVEVFEDKLSKRVRDLFRSTNQLHDGLWLWIKPSTEKDIDSVKMLLNVKRRPMAPEVG